MDFSSALPGIPVFMCGSLPAVYADNGAASYSSMIWISR